MLALLEPYPLLLVGAVASLVAGLMTGLGALPILALRTVPRSVENAMLGFAAGAMLFVISDEIIPETHRAGGVSAAPPTRSWSAS